jgi:hypothetical protein
MAGALETVQTTINPSPWVRTPLNNVLGAEKDNQIYDDKTAVKARWTSGSRMQTAAIRATKAGVELAPTAGDAERLRRCGASFGLYRYPGETDAQFEARIDGAWALRGIGTTDSAIESEFRAYGIPDVLVVEEWEDTSASWRGSEWGGRLCVVLGPNFGTLGWSSMTFPFPLDGSACLGINGITESQLFDLASIFRNAKQAASAMVKIVFRFGDAPVFTPAGLAFPFPLDGSTGTSVEMMLASPLFDGPSGDGLAFPFQLGVMYARG